MKKVNDKFLKSTKYIGCNDDAIIAKCEELKVVNQSKEEYAKLAFEFVRDEIKHSVDYKTDILNISASDTLTHKTGLCFAKSCLLAALLRANNIPAGVCYQRLISGVDNTKFTLHALNGIYLKKHGWFKVDARGNNDEVNVEFNPPENSLAFSADKEGEYSDDYIYSEPHSYVIEAMEESKDLDEFLTNIPDDY